MKTRILIVDDEADFSHLMKLSLEANGHFEVQEENDPAAALSAAHWFDPDVVLMDVMMPRLDGGELAARFEADNVMRDVPIVFLTALVSDTDVPAGLRDSGGRTFLPKTVSLPDLIRCIEGKCCEAATAISA